MKDKWEALGMGKDVCRGIVGEKDSLGGAL